MIKTAKRPLYYHRNAGTCRNITIATPNQKNSNEFGFAQFLSRLSKTNASIVFAFAAPKFGFSLDFS